MSRIELTNVTKRWGQFYAVDNLSMVIEDNAFVTLLGPSGCGKTTTLRMIAGLETPTSGRITIDGVPVFDSQRGINVSANKRKVGFLFQNYALWPNMTVYQNISFGLTNIKEEMDEIDFDARAAARMIEILQKPQDVVRAINECVDKKKKLNMDKAYLRLIDLYEISLFTAKALMGMKLHEAGDPKAAAAQEIKKLEEKLAAAKAKAEKNGCTLGADYVLMKGGQPVRAVRKMTEEEIDLIVRRVARIVKIGMFMDRYPSELSGGQQQRVAIARTLAPNPKVLFMDEPLSNLDAKLRLEMRSELQRLHLQTGSTFVYVTHDQMEAMTLATRICLMENGVLGVESLAENRGDFYGSYGSLFFLGILLSVGFSLAAVLIIYYKQISEGYEDQARFDIMQKVGMTRRDIRSSINSQLLLVFFLPLLLAGLHLAFAFPFVHKLLLLFNLWNTRLLVGTTAASFLAFAALYTLVYRITSNAYYHIVSGGGER